MKKLLVVVVAVLFLPIAATPLMADEIPHVYPVQGFLTDDAGDPIDGEVDIRFRIYDGDDETLHHELADVSVSHGSFLYYIGLEEDLDPTLFAENTDLELGIKVGTDAEMTPRLKIGSVPYAARAASAAEADRAFEADHALEADHAESATTVDGSMTIYQVENTFCEEPPGTLSFDDTCMALQYNLDSCDSCSETGQTKVRNCDGSCGCSQAFFCLIGQPCNPRRNAPRCDNTEIGQIMPLPE